MLRNESVNDKLAKRKEEIKVYLQATFDAHLSAVAEAFKNDAPGAIKAFETMKKLSYAIPPKERQIYNKLGVIRSVEDVCRIFSHPYPQNRCSGNDYAYRREVLNGRDPITEEEHRSCETGVASGWVYYYNDIPGSHIRGVAKERQGILGLTARIKSPPVTKSEVITCLEELIDERIELQKKKILESQERLPIVSVDLTEPSRIRERRTNSATDHDLDLIQPLAPSSSMNRRVTQPSLEAEIEEETKQELPTLRLTGEAAQRSILTTSQLFFSAFSPTRQRDTETRNSFHQSNIVHLQHSNDFARVKTLALSMGLNEIQVLALLKLSNEGLTVDYLQKFNQNRGDFCVSHLDLLSYLVNTIKLPIKSAMAAVAEMSEDEAKSVLEKSEPMIRQSEITMRL